MKPLVLDEVVGREQYGRLRPAYRTAIIDHKRSRRISVGEEITLLFEDRETLRFQVHEMLWVEGITAPDKIQYELDTYNELMPGDGELSATLFIEITEAAAIRPALDRLIGVDEHVSLVLREGADEVSVRAYFDPKQMQEDRISAVQYIKFACGEDELQLFCDPSQTARLRIDHPAYPREVEIAPIVRASLIEGLRTGPVSLLPESDAPPVPDSERVVFEAGNVRAIRPVHPHSPGHLVVEPIEPVESLLDADPELVAELMAAVQRVAAEVVRQHGACRVHADLGGRSDRLCWHVYAAPS
jgi:hypothetical protein